MESIMETELDWTLLPDELLAMVLQKLSFLPDYVHFGAVCKSWNNVARKERYQRLPLLLVPGKEGSEQKRGLYNVVDNTNSECQVSVGYDWRCCGSCHGCLFFASKTNFIVTKPFTSNAVIKLPPVIFGVPVEREDFYKYLVHKAVISCDPYMCPNDYEIVVIFGYQLAIFRAGDDDWTEIEDNPWLSTYFDVIYYKGAFYALDMWMGVGRIEVDHNTRSYRIDMIVPEFVRRFDDSAEVRFGRQRVCYLIESSKGQLVCALKILRDGDDENIFQMATSCFKIFKLEMTTRGNCYLKWTEINTLDGDALFLGVNYSLAINMTDKSPFQPNCIYYTDDEGTHNSWYHPFGPRDVGIFDLVSRIFLSPFNFDFSRMPPAVWIIPSLGETSHI